MKQSIFDKCTKGLQFKIYLIFIGIADLIYGLIATLNCYHEWKTTKIPEYFKLKVNSVLITIMVFVAIVHIGGILSLVFLSRNSLFTYLFGLTITTCLSFTAIWMCFIDKYGILDGLSRVYSNFQRTIDIDTFETKFKCCGWEFISSRCTSISGISCANVIGDIIEDTGNRTGNTLIPLIFIQLTEVLYVIFILVCYSGIDWREIKPFIRTRS